MVGSRQGRNPGPEIHVEPPSRLGRARAETYREIWCQPEYQDEREPQVGHGSCEALGGWPLGWIFGRVDDDEVEDE